jgi:hypothetical protein
MRTRVALAVTGAVLAAAAGSAGSALAGRSAAGIQTCTAGTKQVGSVLERTFCGPARATVRLGGKTLRFTQGDCVITKPYVTVNIGVWAPGASHPPNYFGVDVGRLPGTSFPPAAKDGTFKHGVALAFDYGGTSYSAVSEVLPTTATLSSNRTRGTISGKTITGVPLSASFRC